MKRSTALPANHILEAIGNIEVGLAGHDVDSFRMDRRTRQLVERNLEIISEASRRIPQALKDGEPGIPWVAIAGIGNVLRHDDHKADPAMLWETCRKDLPPLQEAVLRIRSSLGGPRGS